MMFAYSFLAMTAYNIFKPITRSQFIAALGADNLPYVQLVAGLFIGVLMQLDSNAVGRLSRRQVIPVTQAAAAGLLVLFWLLFRTGAEWVSVAFYVLALDNVLTGAIRRRPVPILEGTRRGPAEAGPRVPMGGTGLLALVWAIGLYAMLIGFISIARAWIPVLAHHA
jgi:hypothetical protein